MRISGTLRGVSDANSRKVQLNQNQTIYGRITLMAINFEIDTMVAANIQSAERNIAAFKGDAKDNADGIQRNKLTVYTEITAVLLGLGDDGWAKSGRVNKSISVPFKSALEASVEDGGAGISKASAKRYWENSVAAARGIRRDHGLGQNTTPDAVSELFGDLEITKEAHIVREFVNTREVSPARALAEKVIGKFKWERNDQSGLFKKTGSFVEGLDDDAIAEFEDAIRELKAIRAAARAEADATAAAAAAETATVNATLDALEA